MSWLQIKSSISDLSCKFNYKKKSKLTFNIFAESKEQIVSFTSCQTALRTRHAITLSLRVVTVNARRQEVKCLLHVVFRLCSFVTPTENW